MQNINIVYDGITVDKHIIIPNHIHMMIAINQLPAENGGMRASRPTLHPVIRSLKTMGTKHTGKGFWQESYYDRIIRNEDGCREVWGAVHTFETLFEHHLIRPI